MRRSKCPSVEEAKEIEEEREFSETESSAESKQE